jgi:hypothetical protein
MTEEKWPYNLPIWRRSFRLASPDGRMTAEIANAVEVSMSNPTIGTLVLSTGLTIESCNPSFVWSDDSKYLVVPQYSRNWFLGIGKQRLVVVDAAEQKAWRSRKLAYYIQPETFREGLLTITIEPARKARTVIYDVPGILKTFEKMELPTKGVQADD